IKGAAKGIQRRMQMPDVQEFPLPRPFKKSLIPLLASSTIIYLGLSAVSLVASIHVAHAHTTINGGLLGLGILLASTGFLIGTSSAFIYFKSRTPRGLRP